MASFPVPSGGEVYFLRLSLKLFSGCPSIHAPHDDRQLRDLQH